MTGSTGTEEDNKLMEDRQLHSSQKEALKKVPEFSGETSDLDVDEWLSNLIDLFDMIKLNGTARILETMGKLNGVALQWYQANLTKFSGWEQAENALRERFTEQLSTGRLTQELMRMQQGENQSVTSFYEAVIRKQRKSKGFITDQQVIMVLQEGVKNSLSEYLIRNEEKVKKPDDWWKLAKEEESLQKRIQQKRNNPLSEEAQQQPFFEQPLTTAAIQPRSINRPIQLQAQDTNLVSRRQQHPPFKPDYIRRQYMVPDRGNNQLNHGSQVGTKWNTNACLICNRKNHPTNKCYYKKTDGCYKCGQSNHQIRDCPKRHFFE